MQLFYLTENHKMNAAAHCDPHVVKMPIEAMQLAVTAVYHATDPLTPAKAEKYGVGVRRRKTGPNRNLKSEFIHIPLNKDGEPMKPTHENHPCAIWTRLCRGNFRWTCHYGMSLCGQYRERYDKEHPALKPLTQLIQYDFLFEPFDYDGRVKHATPNTYYTPHPLAMPDEFKPSEKMNRNKKEIARAYQKFYRHKVKTQLNKKGEPTLYWKRAVKPLWLMGETMAARSAATHRTRREDILMPEWLDFVWENYHKHESFIGNSKKRPRKTMPTLSSVVGRLWNEYRKRADERTDTLGNNYRSEAIQLANEMLDYCMSNGEYPPNSQPVYEYIPERRNISREKLAARFETIRNDINREKAQQNRAKRRKKSWGGGLRPIPPQRPEPGEGEKNV